MQKCDIGVLYLYTQCIHAAGSFTLLLTISAYISKFVDIYFVIAALFTLLLTDNATALPNPTKCPDQ
jgi:hypothetical protein